MHYRPSVNLAFFEANRESLDSVELPEPQSVHKSHYSTAAAVTKVLVDISVSLDVKDLATLTLINQNSTKLFVAFSCFDLSLWSRTLSVHSCKSTSAQTSSLLCIVPRGWVLASVVPFIQKE